MNLPRHLKAKHFHDLELIAGVQSFAELEERIAALPTEQARGAALEVFAEACLATQRIYQARDVWPGNSMPSELRQQLRLPIADMGIDGVFVTAAEEPVCYQSKFRTGRPKLTWTELSTFYGLADVGQGRLVFTNCDEIARVAQERLGAIFVRGSDLDRLTPEDFEIIEAWLCERPAVPKKKKPKPHQVVALNDIVGGLSRGSRATALMACGSGKTLVALWAAERLGARTVLVLLPSLALVRQTLHEWLHEASWPDVPQFLCVCSDRTVETDEDSLLVRPSDLDFAVTTKPADVRRFLERSTESVRLVFSTYHSSHVVAEAASGLPPFDFGVFDEAHKTAGRDGAKFALALKDENLPITRRLFMTATPRHYDVARKDKFGESKVVFSMDVPETYGQVVHRLPFRAAAKAGIITDYKVIISVVTSDMVTDEALRRGIVLVDGDEIKARQVANQIALKSAIEKYGVSKVFTFHSKVAAAKSFTSNGPEGIKTHLSDFQATHIEGAMTTAYRERILREFAAASLAILSNARCLTEGVDVPAVDMVAFLSPKRSLVDIVQATGRAMRLSPETKKEFGYVLVPLYVEQARGETVEQAVLRSNFDEIWKVLQGLKEQDDLLAQTIAEMRIEKGRTGGFDDTRFRERVEVLGPELSLEVLRQTISAACIEVVGETWFERYGQLSAYRDAHGDCDIPARYAINKHLATWVVDQRVRFRNGVLEPEKIELLNRLGFKWEPRSSGWRSKYLELVEYKRRFGNCMVPQEWNENPQLATWVSRQRLVYSRRKISRERIAQLDKIAFEWTTGTETWDARFSELCAFNEKFGHTRVRAKYPENPALGNWVATQRYDRRRNELDQLRIERLDSIGFEWDGRILVGAARAISRALERQWNGMFDRFKSYAAVNGAGSVKIVDDATKQLNRWVLTQRAQKKRCKLSDERISLLDSVGFMWRYTACKLPDAAGLAAVDSELMAKKWDDMYTELVDFYKVHGHSNVPSDWAAQPLLARWVSKQRMAKREDRLTASQVEQLDTIAFAWTAYEGDWELMFKKLSSYLERIRSGKGRVLRPGVELNRWMLKQRQNRKSGDLTPEREQRLNSVDFEWEPFSTRWEEMYSRLRSYSQKNGHCRVPSMWPEDAKLARWVQTQRVRKAEGKLSAERFSKLEALDFEWSPGSSGSRSLRDAWQVMYEQLREFHGVHGHTSVPQIYPENRKLGWWVTTQRRSRKRKPLTADQVAQLDALDFNWKPTTGRPDGAEGDSQGASRSEEHVFEKRWLERFQELSDYHGEYGNCRVPAGWTANPQLANWVGVQRQRFKQGKLTLERIQQLQLLKFEWVVESSHNAYPRGNANASIIQRWETMFEKLRGYNADHGDCRVPQGWKLDSSLADWVTSQRMAKNRGNLSKEYIERLNDLGFDWDTIATRWEQKFAELLKFKEVHGHTNVSQRTTEYKELASWVKNQRKVNLEKSAPFADRFKRLEAIGFEWRLKKLNIWDEMFEKLLEYRKLHGDCNVPQRWEEDTELGRWVNTQRIHYRRGDIGDKDRIRKLDEIGFVWNTRKREKRD